MMYAVCCIPVSPLRKEPSHRSEMVSQQLFGEACEITGQTDDGWRSVRCAFEGYEGWCPDADLEYCDADTYNGPIAGLAPGWVNELYYGSHRMLIPMGSSIRKEHESKTRILDYKGDTWDPSSAQRDEATIRELSLRYLNTSYLWGGKSVFGIDCSGFTQTVYKFLNFRLDRDAYQQERQGAGVKRLSEARCGDLAFFKNSGGSITHVGILLNNHEIIHASGKVRIDNIDIDGIVQRATLKRTHQLASIRRYFNVDD